MKPYDHTACQPIDQLLKDCEFKRTRRGGPGGQHRNKVQSAIVVQHVPTGVIGQAGERRSQHENRAVAIQRLRVNLAIAIRGKTKNGGLPSELWMSRCHSGRISISPLHEHYASLLAEALDRISAENFQVSIAAKPLNCSTSQLLKLVKLEELAWQWLNERRRENDLDPLK